MKIRIKDLQKTDRPRERLINKGVKALSDEELISIIIKTGNKENSAKELATILINRVEGIKNLGNISYENLKKIKGIGMAKACDIIASVELGKRISIKYNTISNTKLTSTRLVYDYFKPILGTKKQEYFYCVYLDNAKKIIKDKLLFIGTINYSVVHPREVFKEAYILSASSIICVHNHPAGNIFPSKQDIDLTNNLVNVGNILGIKVLDHIIVGENNYYSFLENGDI